MENLLNKNWCFNEYYQGIIRVIDGNVSETCKQYNLKLRKGSNGVWICALIPLALLSSIKTCQRWSDVYRVVTVISIGQFINAGCEILHRDSESRNTNYPPFIQIGYLVSATITSLLLILLNDGVIFSLFFAVSSSLAYHHVNLNIIKTCPRSFTWGEASLVSQSLILYSCSLLVNIIFSFNKQLKSCENVATIILQTGFFALLFTLVLAYKLHQLMSYHVVFFSALIINFLVFAVLVPYASFNIKSVPWIIHLMNRKYSMLLMVFWVICCLSAVFCLYLQTKYSQPANTVTRKSFHLLIFFVILSGLITNSCLTYLSTGIGFALLVLIEMCRKLKFSEILQECFEMFKDEKDEGNLALTPLYLMVGCSASIWLYPNSYCLPIPLPVLGGIFPIAIGDAAASVGGIWFGEHKWEGSNKTIEGSIFCFVSQVLIYLLLSSLGIIEMKYFIWACIVFAVTSMIEAKTDQIDNLVLPFITYSLFMFVM